MNKVCKYLILFVAFLYLNNCSTMNLEDYKNNNPKLVLENFFSGKTVARGVFEDRFGAIINLRLITGSPSDTTLDPQTFKKLKISVKVKNRFLEIKF